MAASPSAAAAGGEFATVISRVAMRNAAPVVEAVLALDGTLGASAAAVLSDFDNLGGSQLGSVERLSDVVFVF